MVWFALLVACCLVFVGFGFCVWFCFVFWCDFGFWCSVGFGLVCCDLLCLVADLLYSLAFGLVTG